MGQLTQQKQIQSFLTAVSEEAGKIWLRGFFIWIADNEDVKDDHLTISWMIGSNEGKSLNSKELSIIKRMLSELHAYWISNLLRQAITQENEEQENSVAVFKDIKALLISKQQ